MVNCDDPITAYFTAIFCHFSQKPKENNKELNSESKSVSGLDMNHIPPEYKKGIHVLLFEYL
jgi:hypothetical protein